MEFLYRRRAAALDFIRRGVRDQPGAETHPARAQLAITRPHGPGHCGLASDSYQQEHAMMDVIVLGLGVVFFVATIAYAYVCDRL